ncbi:hypothetical protein GM921_07840 [Pedobacter sp. LMG 31464]|uniref:Uncharacterized protein n=1 Tax=Pedobacter planticolens TaxID=2679964 RepID=A0A923DYE2_9SPHI|nr:leucine-rich repeat domain-containing protein [Pedobacter planticolens]MBB2145390.1 hypothetical protein [Pedobacter planticolens]
MKYIIAIFLATSIFYQSQVLTFKNQALRNSILKKYPEIDLNKDGKIQKNEADKVKKLSLMEENLQNVEDLKFFKNLERLVLTTNKIERLNFNGFNYLEELYIANNKLSELNIANMPSLKSLACGQNNLTKVSVKNCPSLESINMMNNQIQNLDLFPFTKLKYLAIQNNKLSRLDISKNLELQQIIINGNSIKQVDITKNLKLKMNNLYIDNNVKIQGTDEQMKNYKTAPKVIQN